MTLFIANMWREVFLSQSAISEAMQLVARQRARGEVLNCLRAFLSWEKVLFVVFLFCSTCRMSRGVRQLCIVFPVALVFNSPKKCIFTCLLTCFFLYHAYTCMCAHCTCGDQRTTTQASRNKIQFTRLGGEHLTS